MLLDDIHKTLTFYNEKFSQDQEAIKPLQNLIAEGASITSRKEFRGHVTCSAIVLNTQSQGLMIHHLALDKWLFPGGHLEGEDQTLRQAALRELAEETQFEIQSLELFGAWFDQHPIHFDCHTIPANPKKDEPEHWHFDFRFVFRLSDSPLNLSAQAEEIYDFKWRDFRQFNPVIWERCKSLSLL